MTKHNTLNINLSNSQKWNSSNFESLTKLNWKF